MKKGQAHVEVIISFVVFITAVTFLLMYIQPQKSFVLESSLVEDVHESFVLAAQTNVTIALINKTGEACKPVRFEGNATKSDVRTGYYYVYVSSQINNALPNCTANSFVIGNIQQKNVLSEVLLNSLKNKYYEDYDSLKAELNIPSSVDFAVSAENYELTKNIPEEISVTAKIYRMQVIYFNGTLETKDFTFKVW